MVGRGLVVGVAIGVFILCILVSYPCLASNSNSITDNHAGFMHPQPFDPTIFGWVPHLISGATKASSPNHSLSKNGRSQQNTKKNCAKLSVFKGREANLNRAIFAILAKEGPKSIFELQKQLSKQKALQGTYYSSICKRIHSLEKAGYIKTIATNEPQSAAKATRYCICPKAHLATFISKRSSQDLLNIITQKDATIILSDLILVFLRQNK